MSPTPAPTASEFLALDLPALSDAAVRDLFLEARAEADRWELVCARLAAAVEQRAIPSEDGATNTATWIQHHAGQFRAEARQSVRVGTALDQFPAVQAAWASGTISASAARTIIAGRRPGSEAQYAAIEPALVGLAAQRAVRPLAQAIRYYQHCADAERPPVEPEGVFLSRVGNWWSLRATIDALTGEFLATALAAALPAPGPDDPRTPAQRRAEALGTVAKAFLDAGHGSTEHTNAAHVTVHVDWATLTRGTPYATMGADRTPVTRTVLDRLLCESSVTRVVTGPAGEVLDVGRSRRTPSRAQRNAVIARDHHCRFPGCDRPAGWSEIHHVVPWHLGGPTDLGNLVLLCSRHHHVIHAPGWTAHVHHDEFVVVTPAGRELRSRKPNPRPLAA